MEKHEHKEQEESEAQELIMKASLLQKQAEELGNNVEYIEKQIEELKSLSENLDAFKDAEGKEVISSIGKGVYAKTSLVDKKLFVEVGSGVLIKKTPEETQKVIESQLKKFNEIKFQLKGQQEIYSHLLHDAISEIESKKQN